MSGNVEDVRFFDRDDLTGIVELFHFDAETGGFTIQTQQDVEPLLEQNKALHNDDTGTRFGELTRVASIPLPIYMQLKEAGIVDDQKRFRKWLNDPDNRYFRTRGGRV